MEGKVNKAAQVNQSVHTGNQGQKKAPEMETGATDQENLLLATGEAVYYCTLSSKVIEKGSDLSSFPP